MVFNLSVDKEWFSNYQIIRGIKKGFHANCTKKMRANNFPSQTS